MGFAPMHNGFADRRLTAWLPGHFIINLSENRWLDKWRLLCYDNLLFLLFLQNKIAGDRMDAAAADLRKVGMAHCFSTYAGPQSQDWWLYTPRGNNGFSFDRVKPPALPANQKIGQRLYEADMRIRATAPRLQQINEAIAKELGFKLTNDDIWR